MKQRVEEVLNKEVRPFLMSHGGNIELIEVTEDNIVKVKLQGGCSGCPGARATLANVVESALKENIPEIKSIEEV